MKKWIMMLLTAGMLLAVPACGNSQEQNEPPVQEPETTPVVQPSGETESGPETTPEPDLETEGGGVLVVYYSATGSTEKVAGYIADALNADTFAITPAEPYTSDDLNWRDTDSRVSREHDDPALRTVELESASVENWDSYDTVFIGYPIWWGEAPRIVSTFVESYDFSGKTVVPFCTSGGSGMGSSGANLEELTSGATWMEGHRLNGSDSQDTVMEWVNSLGLNLAE